jgi:AraC-like DNA-binding protein
MLVGPALYLYVKSLLYRDFKLTKRQLIHLIPCGMDILLLTSKFFILSTEAKKAMILDPNADFITPMQYNIYSIVIDIFYISYCIASLTELHKYRLKLKDIYSSFNNTRYNWLKFVLYSFLAIWTSSLVNGISHTIGYGIIMPWTIQITGIFIFASLLVYMAMKQPDLFVGVEEKSSLTPHLTIESMNKHLETLKFHMEKEKPYLDPNLSLNMLAEKVSIPPRALSQVINNGLNQNFFDFVNSYRIKESQNLLKNQNYRDKTILDILYEAGFNSKSVFNAAFKKHTGMTPYQFRRQPPV